MSSSSVNQVKGYRMRRLLATVTVTAMVGMLVALATQWPVPPEEIAQDPDGRLPGHNYTPADDDEHNYNEYLYRHGQWKTKQEDYFESYHQVSEGSSLASLFAEWGGDDPTSSDFGNYCQSIGWGTQYHTWYINYSDMLVYRELMTDAVTYYADNIGYSYGGTP